MNESMYPHFNKVQRPARQEWLANQIKYLASITRIKDFDAREALLMATALEDMMAQDAGMSSLTFPEIADAFKRYAFEEAEHAAKFAELLGDVLTKSTKKNLELRAAAEQGACEGKLQLAKRAKELNYDAVHDTVHEMAKDEARHGAGFEGLLKRYFK